MSSVKETPISTPARVALVGSFFVLALKLWAYNVSGSQSVLSDALESLVNVLAAGVSLFLLKIVAEPADENHPYGHGKLEYFSSAFEGGLIVTASLVLFWESIHLVYNPRTLMNLEMGSFILGAATLMNLLISIYLGRQAKVHKSEALRASSEHLKVDVVTSVAVIGIIVLVKITELSWLDPVMSLLLATHIFFSGLKILRQSVAGLTDEFEPELMKELALALESQREDWMINIHQARLMRSGAFHHLDAHLVVPQFWTVQEAHNVTEKFEDRISQIYPYSLELAFHLDPCEQKYCESCQLVSCPIRKASFKEPMKFQLKDLIGGPTVSPTKE